MNAQVTDEIIKRIRKCLALAHGRNATPAEMETAMAKAKEIAMRYSIDIAGIGIAGKEDSKPSITIDRGDIKCRSQHPQKYHRYINAVLIEVFGIDVIRCGSQFVYIGETVDVAICRELFPWLEDVFYSTYNKAANDCLVRRGAAAKNGIYMGLWQGLLAANKRAEAALTKEDANKYALIVVNKAALVKQRMKEEFPDMKEARKTKLRTMDRLAWSIGYEKGQSIKLRQVGAGAKSEAVGQLS